LGSSEQLCMCIRSKLHPDCIEVWGRIAAPHFYIQLLSCQVAADSEVLKGSKTNRQVDRNELVCTTRKASRSTYLMHVLLLQAEFNESSWSDGTLVKQLQSCSLVLGLHPDQATDSIVDFALQFNKPFAVVPCCVFPRWVCAIPCQLSHVCGL